MGTDKDKSQLTEATELRRRAGEELKVKTEGRPHHRTEA
jgi:hypothetical protein